MKGRFHRRFLFGAMVAVLAVPILARPPYAHEYLVKIGDLAPDFTIRQADGKTYQLSDLRGKGLHVIGIDRDEPIETVNSFAKQVGISYPLALDPGADIFARYAQKDSGVTRNVIIDRNGRIIFLTRLFDRAEFNKMKARIEEELGKEE
ncbi:MAG: TlpA disulfide reductase family protein [Acidobacteriota bacterium]